MKKILSLTLLGSALALSVPATAQFTVSGSGVDSVAGFGDPGNGTFTNTYTGSSTIFGNLSVTGALTAVNAATWGEDSVLDINNDTTGAFGGIRPELLQGTYTTLSVDRSVGSMIWMNTNDTVTVQAYESFDDGAGVDATWDQIDVTMSGGISTVDLGVFGSDVTFDTFVSEIDTELAVFAADGTLIDTNDDTAGGFDGFQSQVVLTGLAVGNYYVVGSGFNAFFGDQFAVAGWTGDAATGDLILSANGNQVGSSTLGANELAIYEFEVVPEPATMALLGLGALAAFRKRRKA